MEEEQSINLENVESIHLTKNSKGWTWTIKCIKQKDDTDELWLARIDKINKHYMDLYGPVGI